MSGTVQTQAPSQEAAFQAVLTDADVKMSETARRKMAELLEENRDEVEAIRVFVGGGGCSGMSYGMTFTDARTPYDCIYQGDGVTLYVDAVALNFLRGVEIDYADRPSGASFVFNNVFAATGGSGTCSACGGAG
ncbi:MAG: iron-sulfur cluster assembly accessory protein [Chromatiales bacterium 21-64-14]|nr:MAG: iron-sulfur cluster assembly accessory protein [Chromatiales bacterium 21-64-14]HQU16597.1 iron-sulfur cluster assembly accessory protein [Gammaproteobacteria bacterium]